MILGLRTSQAWEKSCMRHWSLRLKPKWSRRFSSVLCRMINSTFFRSVCWFLRPRVDTCSKTTRLKRLRAQPSSLQTLNEQARERVEEPKGLWWSVARSLIGTGLRTWKICHPPDAKQRKSPVFIARRRCWGPKLPPRACEGNCKTWT